MKGMIQTRIKNDKQDPGPNQGDADPQNCF
jgi:hypothetical protein